MMTSTAEALPALGPLKGGEFTVTTASSTPSAKPLAAATADDIAMVRFHGRNTQAWNAKSETASDRFRYLYEESELREWVPRIDGLAESARETHVLMNNCYANYGSTNARELAAMLAEELDAWQPNAGVEGEPEPTAS